MSTSSPASTIGPPANPEGTDPDVSTDLRDSRTEETPHSTTPPEVELLRGLLASLQEACDQALAHRRAAREPAPPAAPPASWDAAGEALGRLLEHLPEADADAARRVGRLIYRGLRVYLGYLARPPAPGEESTVEREATADGEGDDEGRVFRETALVHLAPEEAEPLRRVAALIFFMTLEVSAGGAAPIWPYLRVAAEDLRHTARYLEQVAKEAEEGLPGGQREMRAAFRAADLSPDILALADALEALIPADGGDAPVADPETG